MPSVPAAIAAAARAWRRAAAPEIAPPGSSTTNALSPRNLWFCQLVAVPGIAGIRS